MSRINAPKVKTIGSRGSCRTSQNQAGNGPRGALASHVKAGGRIPPPPLNLFVTSSPDSLALPGMFLIVAFSHENIYNRSMAADRINQRSVQSLFTENEEEVELCVNVAFV